jgi:hypothetical protein
MEGLNMLRWGQFESKQKDSLRHMGAVQT